MLFFTVSANFRLRASIFHLAGNLLEERRSTILFSMNTCGSAAKQTTSTIFRVNTCRKREGAAASSLTRSSVTVCFLAALVVCLVLASSAAFGQATSTSSPVSPSLNQTTNGPASPTTDSVDTLLDEARTLLQKGDVNQADRVVRQCLETHPDCSDGHFLLGHILFREIQSEAILETGFAGEQVLGPSPARTKHTEEKAKDSLAEFTAGAKFHDPGASDLKVVAFDYVLLGDYVDADKWFTRMLARTPNDSGGWYYLGRAKYSENRFAEAINAFQQSLKLDPGNVKAEDNLGLSYAGLDRTEEALAAYKTAISWEEKVTPRNPGPYINLGSLLLDQSRPEEAVPYLLQAIEISPRESKAHEELGKAYSRLQQLPKAQAELEKAVELSPESGNLHCMLAPVYRKQGLTENAKVEVDRCAALAGSHSIPETPRP
jgi:tetratricopeptide (TPR) repeat protein